MKKRKEVMNLYVDPENETREIPMRLLILGDFSGKEGKKEGQRKEQYEIHRMEHANFDSKIVILMGGTIEKDKITKPGKIELDFPDRTLEIPIRGIESFSPDSLIPTILPLCGNLSSSPRDEEIARFYEEIEKWMNRVLHHPKFQKMEALWRSLYDLVWFIQENKVENVLVDILDIAKEEIPRMMVNEENQSQFMENERLYDLIYKEFASFQGGVYAPFIALIGHYEFDASLQDIARLQTMKKIAEDSYCVFLSSASTNVFGCQNVKKLTELLDLQPKVGDVDRIVNDISSQFTERESPIYVGLAFPKYRVRNVYSPTTCQNVTFSERITRQEDYLWGNPAMLLARNMVSCFQKNGWCDDICSWKLDLPQHTFSIRDQEQKQIPIEFSMLPYMQRVYSGVRIMLYDNRHKQNLNNRHGLACMDFSQSPPTVRILCLGNDDTKDENEKRNRYVEVGILCLIHDENKDVFFYQGSQSKWRESMEYTLCLCRIAHYIKEVGMQAVGEPNATVTSIQEKIQTWLEEYTTQTPHITERTLKYYPFKSCKANVNSLENSGILKEFVCTTDITIHKYANDNVKFQTKLRR